ncbi:Wzz/FepE/Etk N-terminal domain-containing protein [Nonomuraea sp. NPDC059194]|uniref:Wzz/FepE/Etk N-terminal domain-containing protein n=1 Tax=Nonomuraea sp. NPDC059194 TaxID=3346764 RepID=UPI0036A1400F
MSSGADLAEHVSLLRRRKTLFLACLLAGLLGGLALLRLTPPAYTATTQVLVASTGVQEQPNQVTGRQREALNLDTEAQVAQSAVVAAKAALILKATPEPADVTVPPNSAVLSIAVTADTPATAAAQSRAYAQAYLEHRTETAQAALAIQIKALVTKLKQVNTSLATVVSELAQLRRGTPEHTIATQRQGVLTRQVYTLTTKYDSLKTVAVTPGHVISQAAEPEAPSSPSLPLYLGSGLMLGLLSGALAAHVRDLLDTALRTAGDVERLTGLPVLADLTEAAASPAMHELAAAVVASCPGPRLLLRPVPSALGTGASGTGAFGAGASGPAAFGTGAFGTGAFGTGALARALSAAAPVTVLTGSDVGDLARADGALLLVGLGKARADDVALAVRRLERHSVPVIGAVTVNYTAPAAADKPAASTLATSLPTPLVTAPTRRPQPPATGDILAQGGTKGGASDIPARGGPKDGAGDILARGGAGDILANGGTGRHKGRRTEGAETSPIPQVTDT